LVAISGNRRNPSFTRAALQLAADGAAGALAEVTLVDLEQWRLSPFEEGTTDAAANQLRALVRQADGLILATPVYHESYSGVLKVALDLLDRELDQKPAALIAVGGGMWGISLALEHLRTVLREMGALVLPQQVQVARAEEMFDGAGHLNDAELTARLVRLGEQLAIRAEQERDLRAADVDVRVRPELF
jgi:NAD(P)H-dependent FMN reductase